MFKYALIAGCLSSAAFAAVVIDSKSLDYAQPALPYAPLGVIRATGVVEGASRDILLRPETIGRVVEVRADVGGLVTAGDVLLRMDNRRESQLVEVSRASLELANARLQRLINGARQAERDEAKALRAAKQAQLNQAIRTLNRVRELYRQAAVPQQQADDSEATVEGLTAEVAAAKARWELLDSPARPDEVREAQAGVAYAEGQLSLAQTALEKCELLAPANGCVLDVHAEPGELLRPDSPVPAIVLADLSRLRVRAFVEEVDAPRLRTGMTANVTADGLPDSVFEGKVELVSPRMSAKQTFSGSPHEVYDTKVREVLIDVADSAGLIVGLRVDVTFVFEDEEIVAETALLLRGAGVASTNDGVFSGANVKGVHRD